MDKNIETINFNNLSQKDVDADFAQAIKKKYNSDISFHGDGGYTMSFSDGTSADVAPLGNGHYKLTGSRMPGVTMEIYQKGNDFVVDVLKDEYGYFEGFSVAKPCSKHPKKEGFNTCFKREWNEFCDGFIGCLAQATNPVLVATAISLHCATC